MIKQCSGWCAVLSLFTQLERKSRTVRAGCSNDRTRKNKSRWDALGHSFDFFCFNKGAPALHKLKTNSVCALKPETPFPLLNPCCTERRRLFFEVLISNLCRQIYFSPLFGNLKCSAASFFRGRQPATPSGMNKLIIARSLGPSVHLHGSRTGLLHFY